MGGGSNPTVTWDVAGTDAAPVSAAAVRITLSVDGGNTFPHALAASTPNDGSESVVVPSAQTTQGRIRIEAVGNIFFDTTDANLTITTGVASPAVTNTAPTEGAQVPTGNALSPEVFVTGIDTNTAGSGLTATATGLPSGLSLAIASTSAPAARPGRRGGRSPAKPPRCPARTR